MEYIKHFNQQAERYRKFRPDYPDALFDYLLSLVGKNARVWDCATGNGQAALSLAQRFKSVIATDINQAQLDDAFIHPSIEYRYGEAEYSGLPEHSINLITVAQALHWFNFAAFYQETIRVLKPRGWIAVWCYSLGRVNPAVDKVIDRLYYQILGDNYWPKERYFIGEAYESIPFPFKKVDSPKFTIEKTMDLADFMGYLSTWSAVKEFEQRNQPGSLALIENELCQAWGVETDKHLITWPIHLLMANRVDYTPRN